MSPPAERPTRFYQGPSEDAETDFDADIYLVIYFYDLASDFANYFCDPLTDSENDFSGRVIYFVIGYVYHVIYFVIGDVYHVTDSDDDGTTRMICVLKNDDCCFSLLLYQVCVCNLYVEIG